MAETNPIAPEGKLWVCCACGKWTRHLYEGEKDCDWWDESCMLNAQLFDKDKLVWKGTPESRQGRVTQIVEKGKILLK